MKKRNILLATLVAACSFAAFADKVYIDSGAYADLAPNTDLAVYPGVTGTWKGTLSRADVVAAMRDALAAGAAGAVARGDAVNYPLASKAAARSMLDSAPDTRVLSAAPADDLTIDGYRFVGGEAGYVPVQRVVPR